MTKTVGTASWTHHDDHGNLWYLALGERAPSPYLRQIHVEAIVDLDSSGRVAGIEIIDEKMPGPPLARGIEAQRAETHSGSVHESPTASPPGDAPK